MAATAASPDPATTPDLRARLVRRIAQDGPMTVAEYMTACLHDPHGGYYATRPALGAGGDFVTAPLVSQMFGELVGAWLADMWVQLGRSGEVRLVELGPGDGTLMSDALRAMAAAAPGLRAALDLWLVEPSAPLQARQAATLADARPRFARGLAAVPGGAPLLLVANEVFDCLPARQFVRGADGWCERRVGLDAAGELVFGLAPPPSGAEADLPDDARPGEIVERSAAQTALAAEIAHRVVREGGAALIVDYGADGGRGDTLQAVRAHRKLAALEAPGEADLTVHVDFGAVAAAARAEGAAVSPIAPQGEFLRALGIGLRAERLAAARPDRAAALERQLARLTAPDQMGVLFKVIAIHAPGLSPPGFPAPDPAHAA